MTYQTFYLDNLKIYSLAELDGYGLDAIDDFVSCVMFLNKGKTYKNCLEWCSGPGYFGFGILHFNLIENLILSDIYYLNKEVAELTIKENNLGDKAKFYLSDNFKSIPKTEKFDLIIGNPPHFDFKLNDTDVSEHEHRKYSDVNWKIHEDFFDNVNDYLTDNGKIILMENMKGSTPSIFKNQILKNNLKITNHFRSVKYPNDAYYLEIQKI